MKAAAAIKDLTLVFPLVYKIFPAVEKKLSYWGRWAADINNPELRRQAMESIATKKFHCQGGSVYSLYTSNNSDELLSFIVSLQTISDYLDNLCDRVAGADEKGFRSLHTAMTASVDQNITMGNWYCNYPFCEDSGYLDALVSVCRTQAAKLIPNPAVTAKIKVLLSLYNNLQVYKHVQPFRREGLLLSWFRNEWQGTELKWWEFAAASGSTLGVFALLAASSAGENMQEINQTLECYFPWICGLHIMLDYFIDMDEDIQFGDLNFASYYNSIDELSSGLFKLLDNSLSAAKKLNRSFFHIKVIKGLLALYLSDPKAYQPKRRKISSLLLQQGGKEAVVMHKICLFLRSQGKI